MVRFRTELSLVRTHGDGDGVWLKQRFGRWRKRDRDLDWGICTFLFCFFGFETHFMACFVGVEFSIMDEFLRFQSTMSSVQRYDGA